MKKLWYVGLLLLVEISYAQTAPVTKTSKRSEGKIAVFFKNIKTLFSNVVINESKMVGQVEDDPFSPSTPTTQLIESDSKLQLNQNLNEQKIHMIHTDENQTESDFANGKFKSVELIENNSNTLE